MCETFFEYTMHFSRKRKTTLDFKKYIFPEGKGKITVKETSNKFECNTWFSFQNKHEHKFKISS